jgi:hypothetical protein
MYITYMEGKIEFFTTLPISNLPCLMDILREHDCSIIGKLIESEVVHVTAIGPWDAYTKVGSANITLSLEHFEDER